MQFVIHCLLQKKPEWCILIASFTGGFARMKNNYAKTAECTSSAYAGTFSARSFCGNTSACENSSVIISEKDTASVSFSLFVAVIAAVVCALAVRIIMPVLVLDSVLVLIAAVVIISAFRLIIMKTKGFTAYDQVKTR